ncbi:hypothetical protein L6R53_23575 [Myxococcota bacterium]|nr:hypothetical protein [Myxococcota bacterium]
MSQIPTFAALDRDALDQALIATGRAPVEDAIADTRGGLWGGLFDKPWRYAHHQIGFLPSTATGETILPIEPAGTQAADPSLMDQPLEVRLDRIRVEEYPGVGGHKIVVNFEASHQQGDRAEALAFNQAYQVGARDFAGVSGKLVFRGVNPGRQGLGLRFHTVHVGSRGVRAFETLLSSPAVDGGLTLLTTAQPALAPLTVMAKSLLQGLIDSEKAAVQSFDLGLDFDGGAAAGHRLRVGSYIAAQVPKTNAIDWAAWQWDVQQQAVVSRDSSQQLLPFNYLVFRISRARS